MALVITFYLFVLFLGIFNSIFCNKMQYSSLTLFVYKSIPFYIFFILNVRYGLIMGDVNIVNRGWG